MAFGSFGLFAVTGSTAYAAQGSAAPDTTWTIVPSPNPGHGVFNAVLSSVDALSTSDAWAVGFDDAPDATPRTLAERWDGAAWTVSRTVDRPGSENELLGVAMVATDDVWAVGRTTNHSRGVTITLIEHFDGTSWHLVKSPNVSTAFGQANYLTSVTALAADDVWAAGWAITPGQSGIEILVEHWNGSKWQVAPSPSPPGADQFAVGIAATSPDDIWAVGSDQSGTASRNLAAHWDGTAWSIVPTPNIGGGSPPDNFLEAVTAIGPDDAWAVGWENNIGGLNKQRSITMHWDGSSWTIVPSPNPNTSGAELFGATAVSSTDVWAVGESRNFNSGEQSSLTMQWDGAAWTVVDSPNQVFTTTPLGAAALLNGTVWAVGATELPGQCCLRTLVLQTTDG
jgi:hypothetical protein